MFINPMGCEPSRIWLTDSEAILFGSSVQHGGAANELDEDQYVLHIYMCTEAKDLPTNEVFSLASGPKPIYAFNY